METMFDGLVALESTLYQSWKRYLLWYAKVPYVTYIAKWTFQGSDQLRGQIFLSPVQCRTILPTKGRDRNFRLSLWIWFASYQNSITPRWKHLQLFVIIHDNDFYAKSWITFGLVALSSGPHPTIRHRAIDNGVLMFSGECTGRCWESNHDIYRIHKLIST